MSRIISWSTSMSWVWNHPKLPIGVPMEPLDVNGRRMPGHSETALPLADPRLSPFFSFGFVLLGELVISDKEGALHRTNRNPVDLKNQPPTKPIDYCNLLPHNHLLLNRRVIKGYSPLKACFSWMMAWWIALKWYYQPCQISKAHRLQIARLPSSNPLPSKRKYGASMNHP